jgi:hypothetical protein
MADYVTDTQALIKFMMGKKVINDKAHQAFLSADKGIKATKRKMIRERYLYF